MIYLIGFLILLVTMLVVQHLHTMPKPVVNTSLLDVKLSTGQAFKIVRSEPTKQGMGERALRKGGICTQYMWVPPQVVDFERKHDEHMYQLRSPAQKSG